jgi:hypothetical protein
MHYQQIELALLVVKLFMLAGVLSVVGFGLSKLLNAIADSRRQERMREQAVVASARARAQTRAQARSKAA